MKTKYLLSAAAVIAILTAVFNLQGFTAVLTATGEKPVNSGAVRPVSPGLPDFAQKTARVSEAYIYAVQNQDKLVYLACYCGCAGMQHSDKLLQHGSLKDCYLKPDGSFEPHASECKLCNDITLEARDLIMKGYSLKEVRKTIDDAYSGRGVGTNTSMPP